MPACSEFDGSLGYGGKSGVTLWVSAAELRCRRMKSGLHFCFAAPDRQSVAAFHDAAPKAGGRDNGKPGLRAEYGPDYYAAFVIGSGRLPARGLLSAVISGRVSSSRN